MESNLNIIRTDHLMLRPIRASDIHHVLEGLSHPEVIRYYAVSFFSLEEARVQMEWYATIEREQTGQWWAICDHTDENFFGAIGLNDIHPVHRRAEIGFWLLPAYWGKGFVAETAHAVCRHAFQVMGLHRIYAYVETENNNSKRVLQKLKFEYEGTSNECEFKNGEWVSLDIYALRNTDMTVKGQNS